MADHNEKLSDLFDSMADLYVLRGQPNDNFREASYRRIAQTIRGLPEDISILVKENRHKDLPGVGPAIREKIEEFLKNKKIKEYIEMKKNFPDAIIKLMDIPSLGPKKVQMLWHKLGVTDKKILKKVLKDGTAEALPGFGPKSVQNILEGMTVSRGLNQRKPYKAMVPIVKMLKEYLEQMKLVDKLEVAGSFRRQEKTIGDIDFLAVSKKPADLIHAFVKHPKVKKILAEGDTKGSVILQGDQQVDLRVVHADEWGAALQYFTGSKDHNVVLRTFARQKGLTINEYGVFKLKDDNTKGKKIAGKTEEEVYAALGLQCPDPTKRKGSGEIIPL